MSAVPHRSIAVVFIGIMLFAVGLTRLFQMRFSAGDIYPAYSSLRSDPLGMQALYEGLHALGGDSVRRNFLPLKQVEMTKGNTYLFSGLVVDGAFQNSTGMHHLLDRVSEQGGRLVLTYRPKSGKPDTRRGQDKMDRDDAAQKPPSEKGPASEQAGRETQADRSDATDDDDAELAAEKEWIGLMPALKLNVTATATESLADSARRQTDAPAGLPDTITWRSPLTLISDEPAWCAIYRWMDTPVVMERTWGQGVVVVVADSFLLSNEGLRTNRASAFLAWLFPPDHTLVIDELHHGLHRQPGIAGLMRKYRLYGVTAALIVLAVLILWRRAAVFVPHSAETVWQAQHAAIGAEAVQGWVNLVQQHIHSGRLIDVCHNAWRSSEAAERLSAERLDQIRQLVDDYRSAPGRKDPVTVYRTICERIKQG
ncbi:MAG: hypothetical protein HKP58_11010 [Desulfatitalea sp.]|nr:hypothetical protein [Desulfatitalea sp.]NNK00930.1 hypothetical protein [Desulfatitalea sp.]